MQGSFGRSLLRRVPCILVSGAVHLALVVSVLAVGLHVAPRFEAMIHAELVPHEVQTPRPPSVESRITLPRPKPAAPATRPAVVPPRLVETAMPTVESPAPPRDIPPPPPTESPRAKVEIIDAPRPDPAKVAPPEPLPSTPEPPLASAGGGAAPNPGRLPGGGGGPNTTTSSESLPSGVSMLTPGRSAGAGGAAAGGGGGSGPGTASLSGDRGGGVTRTAIPRGGYQVQPRYPTNARRLGIQGTTLLRVFVSTDGRVTEVGVQQTAGHTDLDEAAADAVRRWRFEPARRGDEPVGMWVLLPVEFRLK